MTGGAVGIAFLKAVNLIWTAALVEVRDLTRADLFQPVECLVDAFKRCEETRALDDLEDATVESVHIDLFSLDLVEQLAQCLGVSNLVMVADGYPLADIVSQLDRQRLLREKPLSHFAGLPHMRTLAHREPRPGGVCRKNAFIARNTHKAGVVEGMRRRDVLEHSDAMIREILVNALAHADYSMIGMQVKVAIFSNRMEIENPGFFPFGMTIEQFKAGQSKIHNRVIARVFNEIQYLDGWGRAWERIQEAMKQGYPEPEFIEQGATFKVVLWPHSTFAEIAAPKRLTGEPTGQSGNGGLKLTKPRDREDWIVAEIEQRGGIKLTDVVDNLGVSARTARRDLAGLAAKGLVVFVGAPR